MENILNNKTMKNITIALSILVLLFAIIFTSTTTTTKTASAEETSATFAYYGRAGYYWDYAITDLFTSSGKTDSEWGNYDTKHTLSIPDGYKTHDVQIFAHPEASISKAKKQTTNISITFPTYIPTCDITAKFDYDRVAFHIEVKAKVTYCGITKDFTYGNSRWNWTAADKASLIAKGVDSSLL